MKRRSFFLLEVLIAIVLVGGFACLSIYGAFKVLDKERKLLKEIEKTLNFDRAYMKAIAECSKEEHLQKKEHVVGGVKVQITQGKDDEHYLLSVNNKKYRYLVTKTRR